MSALYSQAFDHLGGPQIENENEDYSYQDPEVVQSCSTFRRTSGAGQSGAFRRKNTSLSQYPTSNDMGQGHSSSTSSQYMDISDVSRSHSTSSQYMDINDMDGEYTEPPEHQQFVPGGHGPVTHHGHHNEDSSEYCYAVEEVATRRPKPPIQQRSVSLKDEYSQPHDRLSSFETTQDYTEPYESKDCTTKVTSPDSGDIYSLAKEVEDIRTVSPDNYNHLHENNKKSGKNQHQQQSYDRLATWSSQPKSSNPKQSVPAKSARKISNVSDDVFIGPGPPNVKTMHQEVYRDLPANYEEPWDSEEGQKKFSRLMNRAEKTHVNRQSVDQGPGVVNKGVTSVESINSDAKQCNITNNNEEQPSEYETAWEPKNKQKPVTPQPRTSISQKSKPPVSQPSRNPVSPQPRSHNNIPSNYEDAWDLPEKQKLFEEKLLAARKKRVSHGQLREDGSQAALTDPQVQSPTDSHSRPPESPVRSPNNPSLRMMPSSSTPPVMRSDSCRSLGALAEKIDPDIPLEEQLFYHGPIKRSVAEKILLVFKEGSYLVRKSETSKKDFSLTLKGWNGVPMHMKIACKPDGTYVLGENSPPFMTIPEMVNYYTTHELPVQNADRICLLYPIPS